MVHRRKHPVNALFETLLGIASKPRVLVHLFHRGKTLRHTLERERRELAIAIALFGAFRDLKVYLGDIDGRYDGTFHGVSQLGPQACSP
jgi:hypothetical protein